MGDVNLSIFMPEVRVYVPGCPNDLIKNAVRDACIRFCRDSWIVREDIEPGDVLVDVDDYKIIPGQYRQMISLVSILYDNEELPKMSEEELDQRDPGWRTSDPGRPTAVSMTQPDRIRLNRKPEETIVDGFIPRIVTKPTRDAPYVNDRLYYDWKEEIQQGALTALLAIPEKKWTNIKLSTWNGKQFNAGIQTAKDRATMSYFKKSTAAQPRAWV